MAIRRHRRLDLPLDAYDAGPLHPHAIRTLPDASAEQPIAFLREAIRQRKTILISGGTSTGKTTFLNAMLGEIPVEERVVLVEDTPGTAAARREWRGPRRGEGRAGRSQGHRQRIAPGGLCACGPTGSCWANCAARKAYPSCERSTPAIRASSSTIHATRSRGALDQLALMVMQTGIGLTRPDTIAYAALGDRRGGPARPHRPKASAELRRSHSAATFCDRQTSN